MRYYLIVKEIIRIFALLTRSIFLTVFTIKTNTKAMLKLDFYKNKREGDKNLGKVYARAKNSKPIDLDCLATHMAHHNTVFSKGVIKGMLQDAADCISELCGMGQPVKIDNLCIVSAQVRCKPANDVESFSIDDNITSTRLRFTATGESTPKQLAQTSQIGYTSLAQKIKKGELTLSNQNGQYLAQDAGDSWGDEPVVNP